MSDSPKEQSFNLKLTETQTLVITQNNHQSTFAALLSMIAIERLGYKVTERTQFRLNPEMTEVVIAELPVDVPTVPADTTEKPGKPAVVEA